MSYRVLVNEFAAKIFSMGILVAGVLCHPLTPGYPICREIRCRDVRAIIFSNGIKIFLKKTSSNDVWPIPDHHGPSRVDLQIAKILDSAEESKPDTQGLQENIESLREEKEYWKTFMEVEEWNRDTVREVETAWRKRYST